MSYKIVITKITENVPFRDREYKDTGKKDESGDAIYEYIYFDNTRTDTTYVFEQTVEDLDVKQVVAVVNQIGDK